MSPNSQDPIETNPTQNSTPPPPRNRFVGERGAYRGHYHLKPFLESIERRGLAVPRDLAKEFGWPRSSLSYTFGRLIKEGKIAKVGAGRSTRYRVTTPEEKEAAWQARWANKKQRRPYRFINRARPQPETPVDPRAVEMTQVEGPTPGGLKGLFKKWLKG